MAESGADSELGSLESSITESGAQSGADSGAEAGAESTLPPEYFFCFHRVMELHAEEAGIDLNKYVARTPHGDLSEGKEAQEARRQTLNLRAKQFIRFFNALLESGPESTDPAKEPWLPQYMNKLKREEGRGAVDLEELVKILKPLLFPFAIVLELDEMVEVTVRFAKFPLTRAEYLLDHPDELRASMLKMDDVLVLDNCMINQERHPEADSRSKLTANETGSEIETETDSETETETSSVIPPVQMT